MRFVAFILFSSVVLASCIEVAAAEPSWGDVSGRFVLAGDLDIDRTQKGAIAVNPDNHGLANVVIMLQAPGDLAVHPSYEETAREDVVVNIRDRHFHPRVVAVRTTQQLVIRNNDTTGCNPNLRTMFNPSKNFLLTANSEKTLRFARAARNPVSLTGNIILSLQATVVIKDHPYVAVSDKNGNFKIAEVPAGSSTFQAWHEAVGWIRSATRQEKRSVWEKGKFTVEVKGNGNDLGVITLSPDLFRR